MPSNKDRLYVGLYARGGRENTYHWVLLVGPKAEAGKRGTKYHAKERITGPDGNRQWFFEELDISLCAVDMLLVRITVAKVENIDRLRHILRAVPIRQGTSGWTCVAWVREALELLQADGEALGTCVVEWEKIRETAVSYCNEKKAANRFNGRGEGGFDSEKPPTFDLMKNKEIIP